MIFLFNKTSTNHFHNLSLFLIFQPKTHSVTIQSFNSAELLVLTIVLEVLAISGPQQLRNHLAANLHEVPGMQFSMLCMSAAFPHSYSIVPCHMNTRPQQPPGYSLTTATICMPFAACAPGHTCTMPQQPPMCLSFTTKLLQQPLLQLGVLI